jgi:hypothetical protein
MKGERNTGELAEGEEIHFIINPRIDSPINEFPLCPKS